ncbi:cytochrome oxidase c subunit VIb-domain-containing protein, partial [Mucidula mucida]
ASSSKTSEEGAPTREDRQQCWDARDTYFACLDRVGVVKAGQEGQTVCREEAKLYKMNCAESWIEYFNQRRVIADAQKQRLAQARTQAQNAKR